jgi:predicted Zn-dependent protease
MKTLPNADRFQLDAAEGWLMLGNPLEANEELEKVSPENSYHPSVLSMRWQVYAAAQWWEAAYVVCQAICEVAPEAPEAWICYANTVRNYKGLGEAWNALLNVVNRFPDDAIIRYNLACYAAQLGLLEESCAWLIRAFEMEKSVELKLAAIYDNDLKPLWDKIGRDNLFHIEFSAEEPATIQGQ